MNMNKKQMNHKNKDVHIYSKYRCFYLLYVFNNIYTHHKHLKINKNKKQKKNHKMIKKKPFLLKNKDLYLYGTDIPKTTFVSLPVLTKL